MRKIKTNSLVNEADSPLPSEEFAMKQIKELIASNQEIQVETLKALQQMVVFTSFDHTPKASSYRVDYIRDSDGHTKSCKVTPEYSNHN